MRKTASWAPTAALITAIVTLAALPAHACWDEAAARYRVSSELLYAIARTESALDPQAVGRNRNGTRDIGLMQINSAWLPTLAAHGIGERDLFDPCTSIHVGAWILAGNVQRLGYTWEAVGAYNAEAQQLNGQRDALQAQANGLQSELSACGSKETAPAIPNTDGSTPTPPAPPAPFARRRAMSVRARWSSSSAAAGRCLFWR